MPERADETQAYRVLRTQESKIIDLYRVTDGEKFRLRQAGPLGRRVTPREVGGGPMVRIHLPPAQSLRTTGSSARARRSRVPALTSDCRAAA
jgi:hypothetical protein